MEQLFYAHRELPNFFTALKKIREEDEYFKNNNQQNLKQETNKPFSKDTKPTSFGSSFF